LPKAIFLSPSLRNTIPVRVFLQTLHFLIIKETLGIRTKAYPIQIAIAGQPLDIVLWLLGKVELDFRLLQQLREVTRQILIYRLWNFMVLILQLVREVRQVLKMLRPTQILPVARLL
jgi:hypothetical protein